jgi:hypothetical protein
MRKSVTPTAARVAGRTDRANATDSAMAMLTVPVQAPGGLADAYKIRSTHLGNFMYLLILCLLNKFD